MTTPKFHAHENATGVSETDVASLLQPVLADLIASALNAKQAHWHVRGRTFTQVHEQLDTFIDDARSYADEIAERIVALGSAVDGTPETVARSTGVPGFPHGFTTDEKTVQAIVEELDAVISRARAGVAPLDDLDPVSQDVLIEVLRGLEKHRWMFAAQLG